MTAYNYATDTNGLPKTDFEDMLKLGKNLIVEDDSRLDIKSRVLIYNGVKAGTHLFEECAALESIMKSAEFNVFHEDGQVGDTLGEMVALLSYVYQARLQVRAATADLGRSFNDMNQLDKLNALTVDDEAVGALVTELVGVAKMKDAEYGASWCIRGGIGAWFTTVRKFDRIATQLKQLNFDLWNVAGDVGATEALEETLKDGINYLLLILEKRSVIGSRE